jgi:hypothetical protein
MIMIGFMAIVDVDVLQMNYFTIYTRSQAQTFTSLLGSCSYDNLNYVMISSSECTWMKVC